MLFLNQSTTRLPSVLLLAGVLASLTGCQNMDVWQATSQDKQKNEQKIMNTSASSDTKLTDDKLTNYKWRLTKVTNHSNDANNKNDTSKSLSALAKLKHQVEMSFYSQQEHTQAAAQNDQQHSYQTRILSLTAGCNQMSGDYSLASNTLTVGNIISTQMMCDKETMMAESLLAEAMHGTSQLTFESQKETKLIQVAEDGSVLTWTGTLTSDAQYGQKADVVFWKIDHKQPICPDGTPNKCLNIKPIYYDAKGIKTGSGDWDIFVETIKGYTHDPSYNRVVRLKRYVIDPIDVKGKQFVYEFDRVIESEVVSDK